MFDRAINENFLKASQKFINYINEFHGTHSHLNIAHRVFECLEYISENLIFIASHDSKKTPILRHPENHLAFHLNGNSEEVKTYFTRLINEVEGCIEILLSIENEKIRHQIISAFLNHINDSNVGCMEYRLREAINFCCVYQSTGLVNLEDLMLEYSEKNADITIENILDFFSEKINCLLVKNSNDETVLLNWDLIKNYLIEVYMLDPDEFEIGWMDFYKSHDSLFSEDSAKKGYSYYFDTERNATRYLAYIKSILPFSFQAALAEVNVTKMTESQYTFTLTPSQQITFVEIMKNNFAREHIEENDPDAHARRVAYRLRKNYTLAKSVRGFFYGDFEKGITGERIKGQRPGKHRNVTVFGSGIYNRENKPSPYRPLSDHEIKREKAKRSAFQSTSLITPKAPTPIFNHNVEEEVLAGFLFDASDAMFNRMFTEAGGTRKRNYEFHTVKKATKYFNRNLGKLFSDIEEFAKAVENNPRQVNEALARLRWKMSSSAVGVFADNFESRCIAQYYAEQMEKRLKEVYAKSGKPWDESYKVPIIYYIPGNDKNWEVYTQEQQLADREKANAIFNNLTLMAKESSQDNFEFLLLLDDPDEVFTIESEREGKPLVQYLLEIGKIQIVEALCRRSTLSDDELQDIFEVTLTTRQSNKNPSKKEKKAMKEEKKREKAEKDALCIDEKEKITSLHLAAELGHSTLKYILANEKFDINAGNIHDVTPLMLAGIHNHPESVKLLLSDKRIDVNALQKEKRTAAMLSVANPEVMKIFLNDRRLNVKLVDAQKNTLLMLAAKEGNPESVALLLNDSRIEKSIDQVNSHGKNALMIAVENDNTEVALMLLERYGKSLDLTITDKNRNTPLMLAAENGNMDLVRRFANHKNINAAEYSGKTAVMLAARRGHTDVVDYLIRRGASLEANARKECALSEAGKYKKEHTVKYLKNKGAKIYKKINADIDKLFYAVSTNNMTEVNQILASGILASGIPVNRKNDAGMTPLAIAAYKGNAPMAELLLGYGADANVKDSSLSPLEAAVCSGNIETVKLLAEHTQNKNYYERFTMAMEKNPHFISEHNKELLFTAIQANNIPLAHFLMAVGGVELDKTTLRALLSDASEKNLNNAMDFLQLLLKGEKIKQRAKEMASHEGNAQPVKISTQIAGLFHSYANPGIFSWQHHTLFAKKVRDELQKHPNWNYLTCFNYINSELSVALKEENKVVDPQGTLAALLYQVSLLEHSAIQSNQGPSLRR